MRNGAQLLAAFAAEASIRSESLELPHLALDLDTPEDLERLALFSTTSETRRLLDSWSQVA